MNRRAAATSARSRSVTSIPSASRSGPSRKAPSGPTITVFPGSIQGPCSSTKLAGHEPLAVGEVCRDVIDVQDGVHPMTYIRLLPRQGAAWSRSSYFPGPSVGASQTSTPAHRPEPGRGMKLSQQISRPSGRAECPLRQRRSRRRCPHRAFRSRSARACRWRSTKPPVGREYKRVSQMVDRGRLSSCNPTTNDTLFFWRSSPADRRPDSG